MAQTKIPLPYPSIHAYLLEVIMVTRLRMAFYMQRTVRDGENGTGFGLKNKFLSPTDLDPHHIATPYFTTEDIQSYEQECAEIALSYTHMRLRSQASVPGIPLELLFEHHHFSDFLRHCVFMGLSAALAPELGGLFAYFNDDFTVKKPTLHLCINTFSLHPQRQLELYQELLAHHNQLSFLFDGLTPNSYNDPLIPSESLKRFAFQTPGFPARLQGVCTLPVNDFATHPLLRNLAQGQHQLLHFYGPWGSGKKRLAQAYCLQKQKPLMVVDFKGLIEDAEKFPLRVAAIAQEVFFNGFALCIDHLDLLHETPDKQALLEKLLQPLYALNPLIFLISEKQLVFNQTQWGHKLLSVPIEMPTPAERTALWHSALQKLNHKLEDEEDVTTALGHHFAFTPGQIRHSISHAIATAQWNGNATLTKEMLFTACQKQVHTSLSHLAPLAKSHFQWDDLVLRPEQKNGLRNICDQFKHRHTVYDQWKINSKSGYGKGLSMLFYGPPGTGKTMGAQVMGNALMMDVYKVELSSVVSKYIGDTQKNLSNIFNEAAKFNNILFFDEADALFGKRTELKDSHDRYANADTAYLLQQIEAYSGIVVLATNLVQNFDDAFKRRIKHMVEFPMPDASLRLEIWKKAFPPEAPLDNGIDFSFLAQHFELSGSDITNIVAAAAFLAAAQQTAITMGHILTALKTEAAKNGLKLEKEDFGDYFFLLET